MSNKAKTYIAPNRHGWNGRGATPKDPPNDAAYPTCRECGEPVEPGQPRIELVNTKTPGHGMYLGSVHEGCA